MATWRPVTLSPGNGWGPLPPHATPPRRSALRWLERLLLVIGIASLGYYGYVSAEAALYQAYESRELDAILASAPKPAVEPTPAAHESKPTDAPREESKSTRRVLARGSAIGRIEIPRLGVNAVVRSGSDARTLRLAVGHIPGTAWPGESGNAGLAAHRDTFFRRLGDIQPGDEVRVVTPDGTFRYEVAGTKVVQPSDVWVLDPTEQPVLTLVTCYPFTFVGSAPQRFIVRAHLAAR
jgi:sortase A